MLQSFSRNSSQSSLLKHHTEEIYLAKFFAQTEGLAYGDIIYNCMLQCSTYKDIQAGRKAHCLMVLSGLDSVSEFGDHLIRAFALCENLLDANRVFCKICQPTSYTWTAIIVAYSKLGEPNKTLALYKAFGEKKIEPSKYIYLSVLEICSCAQDIGEGMLMHADIIIHGLETDPVLESRLINMYVKHGNLAEASEVFKTSLALDVISWGTMIAGYAQRGQGDQAIELFDKMQVEGIQPDKVIYSSVLKACGNIKAVELGKLIHSETMKRGDELDTVVANTLIDMYVRFGSLIEARSVFDRLSTPNVVTWGTIIAGYVQHGHDVCALELFRKMQDDRLYIGKATLLFMLKSCCNSKGIDEGQLLHSLVVTYGYDADIMVGGVLVDMYSKCGSFKEAYLVFECLPERNAYCWNALISGFVSAEFDRDALKLFNRMIEEGVNPDSTTLACILTAYSHVEALVEGRQLHDQILRCGLPSDLVIMNSLIDMYAKCGDLISARKVFDQICEKDVGTWSTLIAGYAQHGHGFPALELFERMQSRGFEADKTIWISAMKACGLVGCLTNGRLLHDHIIRTGLEEDVMVANVLVDMYTKCGSLMEAGKLFKKRSERNVVLWNAIIVGHVHHGHHRSAMELFDKMQQEGLVPDRVTFSTILKACGSLRSIYEGKKIHEKLKKDGYQSSMVVGSTLVDMYAKCGNLEEAREVFNQMPNRGLVSWGAMITGYAVWGNGYEALKLYWKMVSEGVHPDQVTLLCVLKACCSMGALAHGKLVHAQIIESGFHDVVAIVSLLVTMYARIGHLEDVQKIVDGMCEQDVVVWNAVISAYAEQGEWRQARKCLEDLQARGIQPVHSTYVSVLAACSHSGQEGGGHGSLKAVIRDYDVHLSLEHFNCLADLLGRAGCISQAIKMLGSTPTLPGVIAWMSALTACMTYGQRDLGRACFDEVVRLDPRTSAGYSIMSNIYASAQQWEGVGAIQELRRYVAAWKLPGKAWIEVDNGVFEFLVNDYLKVATTCMNMILNRKHILCRQEGYVPHTDITIHNMRDQLDGPNEKLASVCG